MPLRKLFCDVRLFNEDDQALIRSLPLTYLNGTLTAPAPVSETLAAHAERRRAALEFVEAIAKLPPSEQVEAVTAKLNELNGVGVVSLRVQPFKNAVEEVVLVLHDNLYQSLDITPLMAFTQLKKLKIFGGLPYRDISCLQFLPLEELQCNDRILFKNLASLKKMETLKRVNGQPAKEYLDFVARDGFNHFANLKSPDPEKN